MISKLALSNIATLLTILAFFPYIRAICRQTTQPHLFSWLIWGIATVLVFFAQLADKGGVGAWPVGVSGALSLYVAWMAYRYKADVQITRGDWGCLFLAGCAIVSWYITQNPLWAVILLTVIDTLGFWPTVRKAYLAPHSENLTMYAMMLIRNLVVIAALEHYSVTTVLFPAVMSLSIVLVGPVIMYRRRGVGGI